MSYETIEKCVQQALSYIFDGSDVEDVETAINAELKTFITQYIKLSTGNLPEEVVYRTDLTPENISYVYLVNESESIIVFNDRTLSYRYVNEGENDELNSLAKNNYINYSGYLMK